MTSDTGPDEDERLGDGDGDGDDGAEDEDGAAADGTAGDDDDDDADDGAILVRKMSSVDGWELFRVGRESGPAHASIALRPPAGHERRVEVAVWRPQDRDEPGAISTVDRPAAGPWNDDAREDVLRQVLYRYEEDLGAPQDEVGFAWVEADEIAERSAHAP